MRGLSILLGPAGVILHIEFRRTNRPYAMTPGSVVKGVATGSVL